MFEQFSQLHFLRPWAFLGFILLFLVLWLWKKNMTSAASWKQYCDEKFLSHLGIGEYESGKSQWHIWLTGIAVTISLLALSGPVWEKLPQPVFKTEKARVFVFDLSRSMMATDVTPNRLARAKHKLLDMLAMSREGQSALIVFAQEPYVVSPLTDDANTIAATVPSLDVDLVPVQGSDVPAAINKAIDLLRQSNFSKGKIILIGDDAGDDPSSISKKVADAGFDLSVLAVGTEQGSPVPTSNGDLLKDSHGAIVIPKLNQIEMNHLARQGNGKYSRISIDDSDVKYLLADTIVGEVYLEDEKSQRKTDQWVEEGPWLVLLLLPLVALGFRKGWLAGIVILVVGFPHEQAYAMELGDIWKSKDQQAYELMLNKQPKEAAKLFNDRQWQGVAHYRSGEYDKAIASLSGSEDSDAEYNKANALAQLGKLEEAIAEYDKVLKQNPKHEDAKYNQELLKKFLEQQQQQKENQQDQKGDDGEKKQGQQGDNKQDNTQQNGEKEDSDSKNSEQEKKQQGSKDKSGDEQGQQNAEQQGNEKSQQNEQNAAKDQGDSKEAKQESVARAEQEPAANEETRDDKTTPENGQPVKQEYKEDKQAMEQWLRRIPDDPGGLLRQKFLMQNRQNETQGSSDKPW